MANSNGLAGAGKKAQTGIASIVAEEGASVVGTRNVPTAHVAPWLRPKSPEQLTDDALDQVAKFLRDTKNAVKPLEQISLNFYEVRGKIFSLPMWSSEFDKPDAVLPEHSVVITRKEMESEEGIADVKNRLLAEATSFTSQLESRTAAQSLAGPQLSEDELGAIPEIDSVHPVTPISGNGRDSSSVVAPPVVVAGGPVIGVDTVAAPIR